MSRNELKIIMYNYCRKNDDYKLILYYFELQCVMRVYRPPVPVSYPHHASPAARVCRIIVIFSFYIFARNNNIVLHTSNRVGQTTRHGIRDKDENMIKIMHMVQYYNNYRYRVLKTNTLAAHYTYVENAKMESSKIVRTSPARCVNNNNNIA